MLARASGRAVLRRQPGLLRARILSTQAAQAPNMKSFSIYRWNPDLCTWYTPFISYNCNLIRVSVGK